jgi:ribosomal protein S18 acetylase RimI-like enzyme
MAWWWNSRDDSASARSAQPGDRAALSELLADTWRRHGLLAVEEQMALLRNGLSTIALTRKRAVGFMGLSPRQPAGSPAETWADLAMAAVADDRPVGKVLEGLLESALPALRGQGITGATCLADEGWLRDGLATAGFVQVDRVIGYAHGFDRNGPPPPPVASIRAAGAPDFEPVLAVNAAAFVPFWRYDDTTVLSWLLTSDHAAVAEIDGELAGFALTSINVETEHAYLIRIATLPAFQGRGVGKQLVADALEYARTTHASGLALNTQASNTASRRLYESLGFRPTGQALSVMVYPVPHDA